MRISEQLLFFVVVVVMQVYMFHLNYGMMKLVDTFTFFRCLYQAHDPPATSPVPDLRVDFFAEPMDNVQKRHSYVEITMKQLSASPSDVSPSMSNTNISIGSTGNSTGINVTSNPMDETATTVTCTTQTPRATIVVQQVNVDQKQNACNIVCVIIGH